MNDDLPELFERLTPRAPTEALRARVLDAVAHELSRQSDPQEPGPEPRQRRPRWERVCEWSVAATLVLGIGLNIWQHSADEAWQTRFYGPAPISRGTGGMAQSETGVIRAPTGPRGQRRLSDARRSANPWQSERYERLLHEFHDLKASVNP